MRVARCAKVRVLPKFAFALLRDARRHVGLPAVISLSLSENSHPRDIASGGGVGVLEKYLREIFGIFERAASRCMCIYSRGQVPDVFLRPVARQPRESIFRVGPTESCLMREVNRTVANHEEFPYMLITSSRSRNNIRFGARTRAVDDSEKEALNGELKRIRSGLKRSGEAGRLGRRSEKKRCVHS